MWSLPHLHHVYIFFISPHGKFIFYSTSRVKSCSSLFVSLVYRFRVLNFILLTYSGWFYFLTLPLTFHWSVPTVLQPSSVPGNTYTHHATLTDGLCGGRGFGGCEGRVEQQQNNPLTRPNNDSLTPIVPGTCTNISQHSPKACVGNGAMEGARKRYNRQKTRKGVQCLHWRDSLSLSLSQYCHIPVSSATNKPDILRLTIHVYLSLS